MEVASNKARGVITSGNSLVLQGVTRQMAGAYTCVASNTEGDTESNQVYLQVKCKFTIHFSRQKHLHENISESVSVSSDF